MGNQIEIWETGWSARNSFISIGMFVPTWLKFDPQFSFIEHCTIFYYSFEYLNL